ncbi:MAG: hypothetical protein JO127_16305 [Caulobacteraceae bacterium]|nr:hypothetical protein [Caulobacteraceae bacterium]
MRLAALAFLSLLSAAASARAAGSDLEFYTGEDLYAQCSANPADADYQPRQARCVGYVIGASDALQAAQGGGRPAMACLQPTNGAPQLVAAVQQYLAAHPEKRRLAAHDLVDEALAAAFPCR